MTDYVFESELLADPFTFQRAANSAITVYDANDESESTPLSLKDLNGLPLTNPLTSSADAFVPPFVATSPQVKMSGGGLKVIKSSFQSVRDEAVAARHAAQDAQAEAAQAGASAAEAASAALADAVNDAESAAAAAAAAAALVGAPADAAIAAAVAALGTATRAALEATIASALTTLPVSVSGPAVLATIGDSVTAGGQGGGIHWHQLVSDYLRITVWNPSVPGEAPADIATRQGGLAPALTLAGGMIPADTSPVTVNTVSPSTGWRNLAGAGFQNIGHFQGRLCGIPGTLAHDQATGAWTFTRTTAGTATACPNGSLFYTQEGKANRGAIQTFWAGRNDPNTARVLRDTASMVGYLTEPKRFLVFGILTTGTETIGTAGHTNVTAANNALASAYPENYFDMRRYLIDYGLAQLGLTPTAQDNIDITGDTVPATLRADGTHPNALGQQVIARKVARLLISKGWVDATGAVIPGFDDTPAPPTGPTVLSMTTTTSTATIPSPDALKTAANISARVVGNYDSLVSKTIMGRYNTTGDQRSWQVITLSGGKLRLQLFTAGTATPVTTVDSTVAATTTAGALLGIRVDFNAAAGWVDFYTSTDGTTWTQLGARVTYTGITVFAGTAPFTIMGGTGKIRTINLTSADGAISYVSEDFTDSAAPGWTFTNGAALIEE